jgi:MoaA/NifB/PqqE/SkfB family radical SAM enzyme
MFWQRIDDPGAELSLEQITKLAHSIPPLRTMVLTGGEPFLRKDLAQIVEVFFRDNGAKHVQIDSNALAIEPMIALVEKKLAQQYQSHLSFQVSLDGFQETHDTLRQTPRGFERTVAHLRRLVELKKKHAYFRLVVLTNINKSNYKEIDSLSRFLHEDVGVEHAFDIVRGSGHSAWGIPPEIKVEENPRDCDFPPREALDEIMAVLRRVDEREGGVHRDFVKQLGIQVDMYMGRPAPFRCLTAGRTIGTIYSDGAVAACEFTKPFAHLADYDFDLGALWHAPEAEARRDAITGCHCCHSCFVLSSMLEWQAQRAAVK